VGFPRENGPACLGRWFPMEEEENHQPPFLDVLIVNGHQCFAKDLHRASHPVLTNSALFAHRALKINNTCMERFS